MSTFNINNINSDSGVDIPEEVIVQCIKDMSETELNCMSEVYSYLDQFFTQNEEHVNLLFTKEEQERFDSYVNDFGEHAVVACLVKNILEKLND
ncbi:hypothetical protein Phab24_id118 [Acinetobacter phage Phab24]|nr:hypothetical protein Phab24_id118 [Acinetobacter phage Phab24]